MKDTNKHSFEEEFKKVFEEAEATPSPVLWAEIDAHLANQEAARYKRRLFYFKLRAAAAIVIIFGFLGVWFLSSDEFGNETNIAATSQNGKEVSSSSSSQKNGVLSDGNQPSSSEDISPNTSSKETYASSPENREGVQEKGRSIPGEEIAIQQETIVQKEANPSPDTKSGSGIKQREPKSPLALSAEKNSVTESGQSLSGTASSDERTLSSTRNEATTSTSGAKISSDKSLITKKSTLEKNSIQNATKSAIGIPANSGNENNGSVHYPATSSKLVAINRENLRISRVPLHIAVEDEIYNLEAPMVQTNASPYPIWQEEEQEDKKAAGSRWSLALAFTPSQFDPNMQVSPSPVSSINAKSAFSGYNTATTLSTGQNANSGSLVSQDLQNAENFGLSYNLGVNVNYALSEKFSLQSGLQYMHNNSQIVTDNYLEDFSNRERYPVFLTALGVNNHATEFIATNATFDSQPTVPVPAPLGFNSNVNAQKGLQNTYPGVKQVVVQNLYQYMSIPIRLHYQLINKKLSTSVGAGVSADLFLKNTVGNTEANVPVVELTRQNNAIYKSMGFSGLVSAKLNYQFSGKYSIYVEPSYRAALSSFTRSAEVISLPNSFGIGTGVQYRF